MASTQYLTDEEIADYVRCMQDVTYFAEKCFVMTPEGLKPIKLRDYQFHYLQHLQNNRFSIFFHSTIIPLVAFFVQDHRQTIC